MLKLEYIQKPPHRWDYQVEEHWNDFDVPSPPPQNHDILEKDKLIGKKFRIGNYGIVLNNTFIVF